MFETNKNIFRNYLRKNNLNAITLNKLMPTNINTVQSLLVNMHIACYSQNQYLQSQ